MFLGAHLEKHCTLYKPIKLVGFSEMMYGRFLLLLLVCELLGISV